MVMLLTANEPYCVQNFMCGIPHHVPESLGLFLWFLFNSNLEELQEENKSGRSANVVNGKLSGDKGDNMCTLPQY